MAHSTLVITLNFRKKYRDARIHFHPDGRIVWTEQERNSIYAFIFVMYTLGRFVSSCLSLKINNKYFLLGLIAFENVAGAAFVWIHKYFG